eukprot:3443492-Prymnesium_polylepis.1
MDHRLGRRAVHIGLTCSRCAQFAPQARLTRRRFRCIISVVTRASSADGCASDGAHGCAHRTHSATA